jgi:hypothetical protein
VKAEPGSTAMQFAHPEVTSLTPVISQLLKSARPVAKGELLFSGIVEVRPEYARNGPRNDRDGV